MTIPSDPAYNPAYADRMVSDDEVYVQYDASSNEDGSILVIRRTVWKKAYRQRDRIILWQQDGVVIPRENVPDLVKDLVASL